MSTRGGFERVPGAGTSESSTPVQRARVVDAGPVPKGTVIAEKYCVERVLGEGAMGIVLAARHLELDELVAVKCIRAAVPWSPDVVARFAREAKASARLRSEHIAKVMDAGVSPVVGPYMVMEYLEGEDLGALLKRRGPLTPRRAAEYVLQICEALALAHASSITHRDVKPENLFLTRRGDLEIIKVLDFGISKSPEQARLFGGQVSVKETQALMGTPLYMSPEQIRSTREVDHRSDIWSLGVVLFELLTGRPVFAAQSVTELCALVLEASPPSLSEFCAAPHGLAAVIERCLMKEPAQRYQSAAELANALLPFAPARARLHAERASAVLRAADAPAGEASPSTLSEGRPLRESSLGTAAPTVLGAGTAARAGYRPTTLALGIAAAGCLVLGIVGFRAFRAKSELGSPAVVGASAPAVLAQAAPSERADATDSEAPPALAALAPIVQPAEGAPQRSGPALSHGKPRSEAARVRGKARALEAPPPPPQAATRELTPAPPEPKSSDVEARSAKPRVRLVDEASPVRLLE